MSCIQMFYFGHNSHIENFGCFEIPDWLLSRLRESCIETLDDRSEKSPNESSSFRFNHLEKVPIVV